MERLGLWGDGAMFTSFEEFLDTVQKKGLGMLVYFLILFNHFRRYDVFYVIKFLLSYDHAIHHNVHVVHLFLDPKLEKDIDDNHN